MTGCSLYHWACVCVSQPEVNYSTSKGFSPLSIAAVYGRLHVMEALLARNANVNFQCHTDGTTAVMQAARAGQSAAVRMLCERGSNLKLKVSQSVLLGSCCW